MEVKSQVITNDDGTTGYISNANKYLYSDDYLKKYKLLQALSKPNIRQHARAKAGGTGKNADEIANTEAPSILSFITKLQKFYFAPPSDNLWTIQIDSMDNDTPKTSKLPTLYRAIIEQNSSWKDKKVQTSWGVDMSTVQSRNEKIVDEYIQQFCTNSGIFLAQNVNFTPHSLTTTDSVFPQGMQHAGFLNFGYIAQNRQINRSLKISFLVSNWDIGDILFEPWIAAAAQRGLVEDGVSSTIKARITIKEYSTGIPKDMLKEKTFINHMQCRKEYIFTNCVPVNRAAIEKSYEFNNAGTFKSIPIEFKFDDYKIKYLL